MNINKKYLQSYLCFWKNKNHYYEPSGNKYPWKVKTSRNISGCESRFPFNVYSNVHVSMESQRFILETTCWPRSHNRFWNKSILSTEHQQTYKNHYQFRPAKTSTTIVYTIQIKIELSHMRCVRNYVNVIFALLLIDLSINTIVVHIDDGHQIKRC